MKPSPRAVKAALCQQPYDLSLSQMDACLEAAYTVDIDPLEASIKELESEAQYTPKDRWNALVNLNKHYRQIIAERNKEITELKETNTKLKARCHDDQVLHMEE